MQEVLRRVGETGGEAWLQHCLALPASAHEEAVMSGAASEEGGRAPMEVELEAEGPGSSTHSQQLRETAVITAGGRKRQKKFMPAAHKTQQSRRGRGRGRVMSHPRVETDDLAEPGAAFVTGEQNNWWEAGQGVVTAPIITGSPPCGTHTSEARVGAVSLQEWLNHCAAAYAVSVGEIAHPSAAGVWGGAGISNLDPLGFPRGSAGLNMPALWGPSDRPRPSTGPSPGRAAQEYAHAAGANTETSRGSTVVHSVNQNLQPSFSAASAEMGRLARLAAAQPLPLQQELISQLLGASGGQHPNLRSWEAGPSQALYGDPQTMVPFLSRGSATPEALYKEAVFFPPSPLGFHLPLAMKEKIVKGEFVDLISLLPSQREAVARRVEEKGGEEERKRSLPKTFNNWLQGFGIFAAILCEKFPAYSVGLFQHLDSVLEAYRCYGGMSWYLYDEMLRQKMAIYPHLRFGEKDVMLWLSLMIPQKQPMLKPSGMTPSLRKGICFSYNEANCKFMMNCKYKHECAFCGGYHPVSRCFKKTGQSAIQPQQKESFRKSSDTSELGKNVAMARSLPKQGDSGHAP